MYLWLKKLFYGCDHEYVFITKVTTNWSDGSLAYYTSYHRCQKCMKVKKDKF